MMKSQTLRPSRTHVRQRRVCGTLNGWGFEVKPSHEVIIFDMT